MINLKSFNLTVTKTLLAFLPIIAAPYFLNGDINLVNFYRLQLGFSIVVAAVTLGMSSYIYILTGDLTKDHKSKKDFWFLMTLFKLLSILLFASLLCVALIYHNSFYLKLALISPISYFLIQQQVHLSKAWYQEALYSYLIPPTIFMAILILSWILGGDQFDRVCIGVLLTANLIFFQNYRVTTILKLSQRNSFRQFVEYVRGIHSQIMNGAIVAICAPMSTLVIVDWVSGQHISNQLIAVYYFYSRSIDGLVGFAMSYILASHSRDALFALMKSPVSSLTKFIFLTIAAFFLVNLTVYFSFKMINLPIALLEFLIGMLKLCLAILSIVFLKKHPNLIGLKEVGMCLMIWLLSGAVIPHSIVQIQIWVLAVVSVALAIFSGGVFFYKTRTAH